MSPLIFVVSLVTLFAFFFANSVMPVANLQLRALLYDIQHQRPEMQIEPGIFDNTLEGYSIRIGDQNTKTSLLSDIWIYDHTDKAGNVSVTVADSGYMKISSDEKHLILTLFNGNSYVEMQKTKKRNQAKTYPHRRDHFVKQELLIEMTGFGLNRTDASIWKNSFSMMSLSQLTHFQDSFNIELNTLHKTVNKLVSGTTYTTPKRSMFMPTSKLDSAELADIVPAYVEINIDTAFSHMDKVEKRRAIQQAINTARSNKSFISSNGNTIKYKAHRLRRYEIEKHRKFTLSISCLIFFFIGAPLGAIIRKGGLGMPVIISVLFFLVWYIISITGEKFVREDIISAFSGMWLASFILIPLSIFLSYKAAHDSAILNIDSYLNFFKKGKEKIKNRISKL